MKYILLVIVVLMLVPAYAYAQSDLVLLSHKANENNIVGEVLNNGTTTIGLPKISAALYDSNGDILNTKHAYVEDRIQPGERLIFSISTLNNTYITYDIMVEWLNTEFEEMNERILEDGILTTTVTN